MSASPEYRGSTEPYEAIGASLRTQVRIFKSSILCRILTAPVGRVWRFTHFYSVAPLLEKWFACFPTSGDGLRFVFFLSCLNNGDGLWNGGFCFCYGQDRFSVWVISLFFVFTHIKTAFLIDGFSFSFLFLRIPGVSLPGERYFLCFPRNNWRPLLRLHRSCVLS